jgi:hypothetical protein
MAHTVNVKDGTSFFDLPWYLERLEGVEENGTGFKAWCPVHADEGSSMKGLSITPRGSKPPLMKCHSPQCGATLPDVHRALEGRTNGKASTDDTPARGRIVATYDYTDEEGNLLHQNVRFEPKDFRPRHKVGGKWVWNLKGVRRVPYHLPELIAAQGSEIWITDGEKDADRMTAAGVMATSVKPWDSAYAEYFRDADVIIVRDKDAGAGRSQAREIAQALVGVAASVRVVEALTGMDAADHLEAGHSLDEFREVEVRFPLARSGAIDGGSFIFDAPRDVPAIWGRGQEVVWASGESLLVVGPQGVGKSTLIQQLALRRMGVIETPLLGLHVEADERPCLYIAADRPSQIQRSFARMVSEEHRSMLAERLIVWRGPLPFNLTTEPDKLAPFVDEFGASSVFLDSLKDVALDLSKDEAGSRVNAAFQETLSYGIEVAGTHHQRKSQANNKKPTALSDVYGSVWVTAGSGSVLLIWGDAGDACVEVSHLKQPAQEFGPVLVVHDHDTGTTEVQPEFDIHVVLKAERGLTVKQAARALFSTDEPDRNQIEKARRKLKALVLEGGARVVERERERGGKAEDVYYVTGDLK